MSVMSPRPDSATRGLYPPLGIASDLEAEARSLDHGFAISAERGRTAREAQEPGHHQHPGHVTRCPCRDGRPCQVLLSRVMGCPAPGAATWRPGGRLREPYRTPACQAPVAEGVSRTCRSTRPMKAISVSSEWSSMACREATGQTLSRSLCLLLLAEAAGHVGQVEEGLRLLAEALTVLEASAQGELLAEAYRLQGELLLRQGLSDAAWVEACFRQALTIARRQQAKAWELRAAMSLSRLWQRQGKRAEAQALLADVYGWFTEGVDTADLQDAKALLEEMETP
jgi:hypothetical protein